MIFDSLKNSGLYTAINPRFERAFEYLKTTDLASLAPGKHPVDGDEIFVNVQERDLKKYDDAKLEVHNKYIDIQVVVRGEESFGWSERSACTQPEGEFDSEKDILFFRDGKQTCYTLHEGQFTIFFPEDAHAPMIGEGQIKKVIVKVLI